LDAAPTCQSASNDAAADAVSVTFANRCVNVVPTAFHVAVELNPGVDAVIVPIVAVTVPAVVTVPPVVRFREKNPSRGRVAPVLPIS
jgi:hypothetical protein